LISYVVQFISTALAGPGILFLLIFKRQFSDGFNQRLSMITRDIVPLINSGNNWITISIFIATAVRLSQDPPVFELDFISLLLGFQLLMALARTVSTCILAQRWDKTEDRHVFSIVWFALLGVFHYTLALCSGYSVTPRQIGTLASITQFCAFENELAIPLYVHLDPPTKPDLEWWMVLLLVASPVLATIGVLVLVVVAWTFLAMIYAPGFAVYSLYAEIAARIPEWQKRNAARLAVWAHRSLEPLTILLSGVLWLVLCLRVLASMQAARYDLQMALGKRFQDSYWGFGQVTIMVMLLPPLHDVVSKIAGTFHPLPFTEQPNTEQASARSQMSEQKGRTITKPSRCLTPIQTSLGLPSLRVTLVESHQADTMRPQGAQRRSS
jgi:hypothetical protein